jgi:hypothetical protein
MSSLWTPGGEVPVNRDADDHDAGGQPAPAAAPGGGAEPSEEEIRAAYAEMHRQLLDAPAADVIAREAAAIYELAALHLGQPDPRLDEARLAIDAVAGLLDGVGDRLGPFGEQLSAALGQLRLAYVERADQTRGDGGDPDAEAEAGDESSV